MNPEDIKIFKLKVDEEKWLITYKVGREGVKSIDTGEYTYGPRHRWFSVHWDNHENKIYHEDKVIYYSIRPEG
jgi:hypothetical protein